MEFDKEKNNFERIMALKTLFWAAVWHYKSTIFNGFFPNFIHMLGVHCRCAYMWLFDTDEIDLDRITVFCHL